MIVTILYDHQIAQVILLNLISIIMLVYISIQRPMKETFNLIENLTYEVLIFTVNIIVTLFAFIDDKVEANNASRDRLGKAIIIINVVIQISTSVFGLLGIVLNIIAYCKSRKLKNNQAKIDWLNLFMVPFTDQGMEFGLEHHNHQSNTKSRLTGNNNKDKMKPRRKGRDNIYIIKNLISTIDHSNIKIDGDQTEINLVSLKNKVDSPNKSQGELLRDHETLIPINKTIKKLIKLNVDRTCNDSQLGSPLPLMDLKNNSENSLSFIHNTGSPLSAAQFNNKARFFPRDANTIQQHATLQSYQKDQPSLQIIHSKTNLNIEKANSTEMGDNGKSPSSLDSVKWESHTEISLHTSSQTDWASHREQNASTSSQRELPKGRHPAIDLRKKLLINKVQQKFKSPQSEEMSSKEHQILLNQTLQNLMPSKPEVKDLEESKIKKQALLSRSLQRFRILRTDGKNPKSSELENQGQSILNESLQITKSPESQPSSSSPKSADAEQKVAKLSISLLEADLRQDISRKNKKLKTILESSRGRSLQDVNEKPQSKKSLSPVKSSNIKNIESIHSKLSQSVTIPSSGSAQFKGLDSRSPDSDFLKRRADILRAPNSARVLSQTSTTFD